VVNKPKSLEHNGDSSPGAGMPKIFKRPNLDEASDWDRQTALVLHSSAVRQTNMLGELLESPVAASTNSSGCAADDRALEETMDHEDIHLPTPEEMREDVGRGRSRSESVESVDLDAENWHMPRRSSGHESGRSNLSAAAFDHSEAPRCESFDHGDGRSNASTTSFEHSRVPRREPSNLESEKASTRSSGPGDRGKYPSATSFEFDRASHHETSGLEEGQSSRGSPGRKHSKNNLDANFHHDHPQKYESDLPEALSIVHPAKEAHADDISSQKSQHSNAGSGSARFSDSSSDYVERFTRASRFQPTAESDDEESKPVASIHPYRSDSEKSTHSDPDILKAGADRRRTEEPGSRKRSKSIHPSASPEQGETIEKEPVDLAELRDDLKRMMKEEVWNKSRKEFDDEFEQRLEDAMHKRLARFGFQQHQIKAMIDPETPATMPGTTPLNPLSTHRPTYPKTLTDYLDTRTLEYYGLPWEYDRDDPNYIVILREMNQPELDILFEHTLRLRQEKKGSGHKMISEASRDKSEHAHAHRRRGGNLATRLGSGKEKSHRNRRDSDSPYAIKEEPQRRRTKVRDASPPPIIKELNVGLQVPPFLAWPTDFEDDENKSVSETNTYSISSIFLHGTTLVSLEQLSSTE
jgi:hypothetical protein